MFDMAVYVFPHDQRKQVPWTVWLVLGKQMVGVALASSFAGGNQLTGIPVCFGNSPVGGFGVVIGIARNVP